MRSPADYAPVSVLVVGAGLCVPCGYVPARLPGHETKLGGRAQGPPLRQEGRFPCVRATGRRGRRPLRHCHKISACSPSPIAGGAGSGGRSACGPASEAAVPAEAAVGAAASRAPGPRACRAYGAAGAEAAERAAPAAPGAPRPRRNAAGHAESHGCFASLSSPAPFYSLSCKAVKERV